MVVAGNISLAFVLSLAAARSFTFVAVASSSSLWALSLFILLFKWPVICRDPLFCIIGTFASCVLFVSPELTPLLKTEGVVPNSGGRTVVDETRANSGEEGSVFIIVVVTVWWTGGFGKLLDICSVSPVSASPLPPPTSVPGTVVDLFETKVAA